MKCGMLCKSSLSLKLFHSINLLCYLPGSLRNPEVVDFSRIMQSFSNFMYVLITDSTNCSSLTNYTQVHLVILIHFVNLNGQYFEAS